MNGNKLTISLLCGAWGKSQVDSQLINTMDSLELVQEAHSIEAFWTLHKDAVPDIVLIDLDGLGQIPDGVETLVNRLSQSAIIICSHCMDSEFLLRLLQLNVQFIPLPLSKENLESAIVQARQKRQQAKPAKPDSRLVALAGSREGVGITAIATNLAIALAEQTPGRVVLVDLARPFPAVCQFLNIKDNHNIIDLIQNADHFDPQFVENVLYKYNHNLSILLGNPDLTLNTCSILTDNVLNKIFKALESSFDWIVVDLGYWIDSVYLYVLDEADVVLLLTELSVPDLHNLGRISKLFNRYNINLNKIKIVVNRYEKNNVLRLDDIESHFMQPIFYQLPSDYDSIADAINQGESLAEASPNSKLWRSIKQLATELIIQSGVTPPNGTTSRPGLFKRLFSSKR
jgi:pilus assembly protein CpaE